MSEEIEVLKIVTGRLERAGIGYMVTGSMALNYYALPRMTRDIDLVVELSSRDAERIVELAVDGQELFIVAPEDLVISKLDWARDTRSEIQLGDVRNLLESVRDLDRAYLAEWIAHLGLDALYREVSG